MMTHEGSKESPVFELVLYIAGQTPKSVAALTNLRRMCEDNLDSEYRIEVIDLAKDPKLAREQQIVAIPTLIKKLPLPMKRIIGDLSNEEKVLVGLEIKKRGERPGDSND
jgi:circadian clock protein KaiB